MIERTLRIDERLRERLTLYQRLGPALFERAAEECPLFPSYAQREVAERVRLDYMYLSRTGYDSNGLDGAVLSTAHRILQSANTLLSSN